MCGALNMPVKKANSDRNVYKLIIIGEKTHYTSIITTANF